jgi:transcriptional regulator with PAS, ATPase and Fis domain
MGLLGRYMSVRDLRLIKSINIELLNDVIQTEVTVFKISPELTTTNIYGETNQETGKSFCPGIEIACMIEREENLTEMNDFGPSRKQGVIFKFMEDMLKNVNFYPETGDIVMFNDRYHEIDNVVQEQFLGGIPEKSFSIICNTHYSRLSKLNIVTR